LFDDFWKRYEPAKERDENPPYVTFDCANEEGFIEK
jgi:AGCS family alanine or glycine:cation symporter